MDVLVALGRVLGVLDRPVGAAVEPRRVLLQPGMVRGALDREVERDLEPRRSGGRDHRVEVLVAAEIRMERVVPADGGADRPGTAGIALLRALRVVPPLAERLPDGVHGREVDDVDTNRRELGQHRRDAPEAAPRAWEELVPDAEPSALAVDVDPQHGALHGTVALPVGEMPSGGAPGVDVAVTKQLLALGELAGEVRLAGGDLAIVLVEPTRVGVDPGLHAKLPGAERVRAERRLEAVVARRLEPLLAPAPLADRRGSGRLPRASRAHPGRSSPTRGPRPRGTPSRDSGRSRPAAERPGSVSASPPPGTR